MTMCNEKVVVHIDQPTEIHLQLQFPLHQQRVLALVSNHKNSTKKETSCEDNDTAWLFLYG